MIVTHTLSNFLSSLQNHSKAKKTQMYHPQSKLIINIVNLLIKEGYLRGYTITSNKKIIVFLKYKLHFNFIDKIKILSKPGKRNYINSSELYDLKTSGLFIISTSTRGVISLSEAKKFNCGGELICHIN